MFNQAKIYAALCILLILILSFSSSHPVGRSGAPGDGLCSDCHSSTGSFDGDVNILGIPDEIAPGEQFSIVAEVSVSSGSPIRGGFQIVSLFDSNNGQAGSWSNSDGSSSLKNSGGRTYFGHEPFQTFGAGSTLEWEADWEAPVQEGNITFYMAANLANGNGSTSGDKIIVNQFNTSVVDNSPLEIIATDAIPVSCIGDMDGIALIEVQGGVPPYDIMWSNGDSGTVADNLPAGPVSVTIEDSDNNTLMFEIEVPEPDEIEFDLVLSEPSCEGGDDGEIELIPFGGTGSLTCAWEDFNGGCFQDDLEAGDYRFTITDSEGCTITDIVTLGEPTELVLDITTTDDETGTGSGSIICTPQGGEAPYDFEWSNGFDDAGLSSVLQNLTVGLYVVTVTDDNGCFIIEDIEIEGTVCNLSTDFTVSNVSCFGDSTGAIQLQIMNATSPVSYLWSNGATTQNISNLQAGSYSVSISDASNCVDTLFDIVVQQNLEFKIDSLEIDNVMCAGDSTGSVVLYPSGGTPEYDIAWSHGLTNDTLIFGTDTIINIADSASQLAEGVYTYTITDALGCTIVDSVAIQNMDNSSPLISLDAVDIFINDFGTHQPVEVDQLIGEISDNCSVERIELENRPYSCSDLGQQFIDLTVFDTNGNSSFAQVEINVLDTIGPNIFSTSPDFICNETEIVLSTCTGVNYPAFDATDNCGSAIVELDQGLPSGDVFPVGTTRVVYVATDNSGNSSSCYFDVTVQQDLQADAIVNNVDCVGNNGSIELMVSGGTPPYQVSPSNLDNLTAGDYTVIVSDQGGCQLVLELSVEEDTIELDYNFSVLQPLCDGETGSVFVEIQSSGDYTIEINGIESDIVSGLPDGEYEIVISDNSSNCSLSELVVVDSPQPLNFELLEIITDSCSGFFVDALYNITGGTGAYNVELIDNVDEIIFNVSDANGCMLQITEAFTPPIEQFAIRLFEVANSSADQPTGFVNIEAIGGTEPYTYIWSDADGNVVSTDEDLIDVFAGEYNLVVSDAIGCSLELDFIIEVSTSTGEIEDEYEWTISPNPASAMLKLEYNGFDMKAVQLYDIQGRRHDLSMALTGGEQMIDVGQLLSGIYLIAIQTTDGKLLTRRFVKQ